MENIDQVRKELKEELRAEMRQLRDELLQHLPPEEEAAREAAEITKDVRRVLTDKKENFTEYTEFDPETASVMLKPLANTERLKILQALYTEGKYFTDMVDLTGLEHSPLRFHLSSLIDAGYAEQERYRGRYLITVHGKIALRLVGFLVTKKGDTNDK
ncbi:MAG: winged helix-turn-helix domain-containing protein [Candidatus Methanofastidiosia archaeon]